MSSLRNNFVYLMLFKLLSVFKFSNKRGLGFFINEDIKCEKFGIWYGINIYL